MGVYKRGEYISREWYTSLLELSPDKFINCIIIIKNGVNNKV
jgi:hypothetical protein